ncbi:hypothetical protein PHMEG_00024790 [Phytophthora megakarya]|uniref:M96 mating-specific protein n=1 Tax=Phytophthora megakarya TaxID=4795 RepID=A0A225VDK6_9STRA|nr:hypothetical protein PHMEG_00024790 [Phytophthora megakarya]
MTTSDADFLAEVDNFLTFVDLPTFQSPILAPNDDNCIETSSNSNSMKTSKRLVGIAPQLKPSSTRRLKIKNNEDDAAKRELERAKDRKRRRAYRERRLVERKGLEEEIENLTAELKKAQGHAGLITSAWKLLAERQLAARMIAEAEQRLLCDAIDKRAALLMQFQELMNDRITGRDTLPGSWDIDTNTVSTQPKRIRLECDDDAIFSTLIKELDGIYTQTDEILHSRRLDATYPNWDEPSESWVKDSDTGFFLYGGKQTLPFDFRDICRSRWYKAPLPHRQESRQLYKDVEDPDNTVAFKFRITTRLKSGKIASVLQRFTLRRYRESERMVIVWRLFTEGEGMFNGMNADETGWSVTTPAVNSTKTGTVMLTCVQNVPMHLNSVTTEFLEEVENFLISWELPSIPAVKMETYSALEKRSKNVKKVKKMKKVKNTVDDKVKRELGRMKERNRRIKNRERRQTERENLLLTIDMLTRNVDELKEDKHRAVNPSWKVMAQAHLTARLSAEAMQRNLMAAIVEAVDAEIFTNFIQELDTVYSQTDETLLTWGMNSTEENWNTPLKMWSEDARTGNFHFRGKFTLPYDFQHICEYRWKAAHLIHRQKNRELYEHVIDQQNTVALKFRVSTRLTSGQTANVLHRIVFRRYEEDNRMVLVWRLFTEGEGAFNGMHCDETGWGVATPAMNSSKVGTTIRTCVRNVPLHLGSKGQQQPIVAQFTNKLLEWGLENDEMTTTGLLKLQ